MRQKLTFKEKAMLWLGYRYIANPNSREIHDLKEKRKHCNLAAIQRKIYITAKEMQKMANYNGCYHCLRKYDTDKPLKP